MFSRDAELGMSISDYRSQSDVNTFLLAPINDVLNQVTLSVTVVTESLISLVISQDYCRFYQNPDYTTTDSADFTFQTMDLKTLVTGWLTFVSET